MLDCYTSLHFTFRLNIHMLFMAASWSGNSHEMFQFLVTDHPIYLVFVTTKYGEINILSDTEV